MMLAGHWKGARLALAGTFFVLLPGCAHVISENMRGQADPSLPFAQLFRSPDDYTGKRVLLGGVIVKTRNLPDGAEIEVAQKELDVTDTPVRGDASGGRFIFLHRGFLEPEIYAQGREVAGAGKIIGSRQGKVDERDYRFPLVEAEELHLLEKVERHPYPPWYWDPWYHPWYPYWR